MAWMRAQDEADMHITTITIGEIFSGIARQETRDAAFANDLSGWFTATLRRYEDRILDFDRDAAVRWGRLVARIGHSTPDTMIAAIALSRGAVVATMNTRHFEPLGVRVVNPFA
jgi:toxin FitB